MHTGTREIDYPSKFSISHTLKVLESGIKDFEINGFFLSIGNHEVNFLVSLPRENDESFNSTLMLTDKLMFVSTKSHTHATILQTTRYLASYKAIVLTSLVDIFRIFTPRIHFSFDS